MVLKTHLYKKLIKLGSADPRFYDPGERNRLVEDKHIIWTLPGVGEEKQPQLTAQYPTPLKMGQSSPVQLFQKIKSSPKDQDVPKIGP